MSHRKHLDVAIEAAQAAGELISKTLSQPKNVQFKGAADLVTQTDKQCEASIRDVVSRHFPDYLFIGEETSGGEVALTEVPTWICDPLDGTTNFVHQYPSCCVSLALYIKQEPVVGVVFNPVLQELFTAETGQGAFLNGTPIHTSDTTEMHSALFATELGVVRDPIVIQAIFNRISKISLATRSLRCGGSVALDLCHVACGRLDFCYEIGFGGCWDVAAAALIVKEAGGEILDPTGSSFRVMARRVMGANGVTLAQAVTEILSRFELYPNEPPPSKI